jgi:hypothetical protein
VAGARVLDAAEAIVYARLGVINRSVVLLQQREVVKILRCERDPEHAIILLFD